MGALGAFLMIFCISIVIFIIWVIIKAATAGPICPVCGGQGKIKRRATATDSYWYEKCFHCNGKGFIKRQK